MKAAGKVLVVTGAGSGMGRQVALEILRRSARVAAVDVNEKTLGETVGLANTGDDRLATFTVDVTDRAAVEALPRPSSNASEPSTGSSTAPGSSSRSSA